jgi:hypothetical protein
MKHLCQGPDCHTYDTQSRIRGVKGNKVLRTRNARYDIADRQDYSWAHVWEFYFCDLRCKSDWLAKHMTQLINFVGLKTKPQESPIDIIQETRTDWRDREYISTTIKLKQNENNVLTENPI